MSARNACRAYRPLRGGIQIRNEAAVAPGTLGLIAVDSGGRHWLLSSYHVLLRTLGGSRPPIQNGETVLQPDCPFGTSVARIDVSRANADSDYAAALIEPGIAVVPEILGLGAL